MTRCHHAVLQKESFGQISYGPATFAIVLQNEQQATRLPHALRLFAVRRPPLDLADDPARDLVGRRGIAHRAKAAD